jgi:hypothetical protein
LALLAVLHRLCNVLVHLMGLSAMNTSKVQRMICSAAPVGGRPFLGGTSPFNPLNMDRGYILLIDLSPCSRSMFSAVEIASAVVKLVRSERRGTKDHGISNPAWHHSHADNGGASSWINSLRKSGS